MKAVSRCVIALFPLLVAGCGVHSDKAVAKAALDTSSQKQRDDSIEATAQLLDEKPEMVDELYRVVRAHPKTIDRFMKDAAGDLEQKAMAKAAAGYIVEHPAAVEEVMGESIIAIEKTPAARAATNKSLTTHSAQAVDIVTDDPHAMAQVVKSLLSVLEKKPAARKNIVLAIREDRPALVALVKEDKELSRAIAAEVLKEAVKDKPVLEKVLAALGALDTPQDVAPKSGKSAEGEAPITK